MNLIFAVQEEATKALLEQGVMGVFILVLLTLLGLVWKAKEKNQERLWELSKEVNSIMANLANVVDNVYKSTENLPEKVSKELANELNQIKNSIDNLNDKLK